MGTNGQTRTFEAVPAARERVPVWLGLYGPSGSGKTRSALRVATGIQAVAGGKIGVIDTESKRAKHYAPSKPGAVEPNTYNFEHVDFRAPFDPLDYLGAVEYLASVGCCTIIVDSMSHEHEGPGGIREQHMAEVDRLAAEWKTTKGKVNFPAWNAPKGRRRRAINSMLQVGANMIFCFRGREKEKPAGDKLIELGFMPIAGEEWVYEMTLCALLMPAAGGVPTWKSKEIGENQMIKTVDYLRGVTDLEGPLSEAHGEALARWAMGGAQPSNGAKPDRDAMLDRLGTAQTDAELDALLPELKRDFAKDAGMKTAHATARERVKRAATQTAGGAP